MFKKIIFFLIIFILYKSLSFGGEITEYEKLQKLGFSSETATNQLTDCVTVQIKNGTVAMILVDAGGNITRPARLNWQGSDYFSAEKCEIAGGGVFYKVKSFIFILDDLPQQQISHSIQKSPVEEVKYDARGIKKPEKIFVEHEPQGGVYVGGNNLSRWAGGWVKYKASFHPEENESGIVPGVGAMASFNSGRSRNGYEWKEYSIGPVVGVKKYWDDEDSNPWLAQADISPQYYNISGKNPKSGYWHKQSGIKLNARGEIQTQYNEDWVVGGVLEGNLGLSNNFSSSWKGDRPSSNRGSMEVGGYGIYRINNDWEYEIYGGTFYQGWDKLWGVKIVPMELIYKKYLKAGIGFSFFPFGLSDAYKGISAGDLFTPWAFVQLDGGPIIRKLDAEKKSERVRLEKAGTCEGCQSAPVNQNNKK